MIVSRLCIDFRGLLCDAKQARKTTNNYDEEKCAKMKNKNKSDEEIWKRSQTKNRFAVVVVVDWLCLQINNAWRGI